MTFHRIIGAGARLALLGLGLVVLSACAGMQLDKARQVEPKAKATAFTNMLHRGYMNLAREEYAEYDHRDSDHFADKAMAVAAGDKVEPDQVSTREIPANRVKLMTAVRARLMTALDGGARKKAAASSAFAQVMYDCWIQELEENLQPADIAKCRDGFTQAIALSELAIKKKKKKMVKKAMKKMMKKKKMMKMAVPGPKSFTILFGHDSTHLDTAAHVAVGEIAQAVAKHGNLRVFLAGHTDRSGDDAYNAALSQKRADAVAYALMDAGVDASKIRMAAKGESETAVGTADGAREAGNRRVGVVVRKK